MRFDKTEVARRQLGTALHLFLNDQDPVAIHVLAAGGMEIADALVRKAGKEAFRSIAVEENPGLTEKKFIELKNKWWNSFKHFSYSNGQERDDKDSLAEFNDESNEMHLLIGWLDFGTATGSMPIEAQLFQAWFFARHPETLAPNAKLHGHVQIFPDLKVKPRTDQKKDLVKAIRKAQRNHQVMNDPRTERRNLLLPNNLKDFER